MIAELKPN